MDSCIRYIIIYINLIVTFHSSILIPMLTANSLNLTLSQKFDNPFNNSITLSKIR